MTLGEALSKIDVYKPNQRSTDEKLFWLTQLDGMLKTQLIDNHDTDIDTSGFEPYTQTTPSTQELLVPAPFDSIYVYWLAANIDLVNQEIDKYNNSASLYDSARLSFADWVNHYKAFKNPKPCWRF